MRITLEDYEKTRALGLRALREGKLLIFPTDTVYGIGGDATSAKVVEKVCAAKGRERKKPLAVVMSGLGMIREWCEVHEDEYKALMENLPGPYTFILKLKEGSGLAEQKGKIGVRVPNYFFLTKLVHDFGKPVIATSANRSGGKDPRNVKKIDARLLKAAALVIDGGETALKQPSTVVDLVERKILRKGAGKFKF